ncbi:MAG: phenylalanine--tRNA ligase subunit beta [Deltaproteobacteria bacterium RIFOXYD12_FULL_57_12]|nr:MAG: phenylalanine--tRNA ligase subunit beta [Deltaproteobacteria bacterium RIFOXYD12_FULL_57_12]
MKFTLNWLKEYLDIDLSVEAIADRLTMLGLEVDSVTRLHEDIASIRVARIVTVQPHPNADRLTICEVEVGGETKRVVCGAPNARAGLLTAIALPGCTLPSGLEVREATLRGERSAGMLCSEKELGLSEEHGGIMELPESVMPGQPVTDALGLRDTVIEVDLTPNRPDCASVIGIAREMAGATGRQLRLPAVSSLPDLNAIPVPFAIEVQDTVGCPRYAARLLRNVKIGPSPRWVRNRLQAIGQRPINNVVDITNLVMMELGQPLHAFDFRKLANGRIVVRRAAAGESLTTLDGVARALDPEMLMICDAEKPVAVAGIMGGANSEVGSDTVDILLESACFDPVSVRRTARRLNLGTEASYRFERGVDPGGVVRALERAVQLMVEVAGAEVVAGGVDCLRAGLLEKPTISLRVSRTNELIGTTLTAEAIAACLAGIEIGSTRQGDDLLIVQPPSFRVDIEREVDLVEEVARLTGYNEIPSTLPTVPMSFPEQGAGRLLGKHAASVMTALGFSEVINYSFVNEQFFDRLGLAADDPARQVVRLLNPLTEEQAVMRTMLLPGILENVRHNIYQQNNDIRLFEIGKVFLPRSGDELPTEIRQLTAVLSGRRHPGAALFHEGSAEVDAFDVKGAVEAVLNELGFGAAVALQAEAVGPAYVAADTHTALVVAGATGAAAVRLGGFGKLAGEVLRAFGIKQDVYYINLDLDGLDSLPRAARQFSALPRYPAVQWDIALVVPEMVAAGEMLAAIRECREPLLEHAEIFDVYRGKPIEAGRKSVAFTLTYRSAEQTLDDETVETVHQRILNRLVTDFDGRLREAH